MLKLPWLAMRFHLLLICCIFALCNSHRELRAGVGDLILMGDFSVHGIDDFIIDEIDSEVAARFMSEYASATLKAVDFYQNIHTFEIQTTYRSGGKELSSVEFFGGSSRCRANLVIGEKPAQSAQVIIGDQVWSLVESPSRRPPDKAEGKWVISRVMSAGNVIGTAYMPTHPYVASLSPYLVLGFPPTSVQDEPGFKIVGAKSVTDSKNGEHLILISWEFPNPGQGEGVVTTGTWAFLPERLWSLAWSWYCYNADTFGGNLEQRTYFMAAEAEELGFSPSLVDRCNGLPMVSHYDWTTVRFNQGNSSTSISSDRVRSAKVQTYEHGEFSKAITLDAFGISSDLEIELANDPDSDSSVFNQRIAVLIIGNGLILIGVMLWVWIRRNGTPKR